MFTREGDDGVHRHIQRRGSGPGVQPDKIVCIPRGKRQPQRRPVHRGQSAHTQRMVQLPELHPRTVRPTECFPRAQNQDAKSRGTRDNAVRLRHVEPARVSLRHAAPSHHRFLTRCIGWRKHSRATNRFPIWTRLSRREVRASRRLYSVGRSCLRDLWRAWRIRDCQSAWCSENWWGTRAVWGARKKSGWGVSWTTSELSASTPAGGRLQPRTRGNGAQRRNISCRNGSLQRKPRLDYGMQWYARTWREGPRRG